MTGFEVFVDRPVSMSEVNGVVEIDPQVWTVEEDGAVEIDLQVWTAEEDDAVEIDPQVDGAVENDLQLHRSVERVCICRLLGVVRRIENLGTGSAIGTVEARTGRQGQVHAGEVFHLVGGDIRGMIHRCADDVAGPGLPNSPGTVVPKGVVRGVLSVTVLADDVAVADHPCVV